MLHSLACWRTLCAWCARGADLNFGSPWRAQTGSSLLQHVSKLEEVSLADKFVVFLRMEVRHCSAGSSAHRQGTTAQSALR